MQEMPGGDGTKWWAGSRNQSLSVMTPSFYSRFDKQDFSEECEAVCTGMTPCPVILQEREVISVFQKANPHNVPGPDGLKRKVLKERAARLGHIVTQMWMKAWKTTSIIPVPKTPHVKSLNDVRPIALTPLSTKCMERLMCKELSSQTAEFMDPMQFA